MFECMVKGINSSPRKLCNLGYLSVFIGMANRTRNARTVIGFISLLHLKIRMEHEHNDEGLQIM